MALDEIVARKRKDIRRRKKDVPLSRFEAVCSTSDRSLVEHLQADRLGFMLECKRRSPSAGRLRDNYDPAQLAKTYAGFADGISVLTDEPYFEGRLEHLAQVRRAVDVPVFCKDFILDPYQIYEARVHGADAVLLMLSVLDDRRLRECMGVARNLGMEVVAEVHDQKQLRRALETEAQIIGINNRDLQRFEIDFEVTKRLAPKVPEDRLVLGESGIATRDDVLELAPYVDGLLIGSALARTGDLEAKVRRLVAGRVKICGLTRPDDAAVAWRAGASFGGLIFAEQSPRAVDVCRAHQIRRAAPLRYVGVFVDEAVAEVARLAERLQLAAVQLHGDEDGGYVERLRTRLPGDCQIWQVGRFKNSALQTEICGDRLLVDTYDPEKRGGTGRTFDWTRLDQLPPDVPVVLSGGLSPDNVREAVRQGTWALDANSGLEDGPGIKNPTEIERFFANIRRSTRRTA